MAQARSFKGFYLRLLAVRSLGRDFVVVVVVVVHVVHHFASVDSTWFRLYTVSLQIDV